MTDSADQADSDDPYRVRRFPTAELVRIRRESQADLVLYPAGTKARQRLREYIAAIDTELAERAGR